MPLPLNYISVCIYMFLHSITFSALICLCMLYNIIVDCTSSWVFCRISILVMGYYSTVLLLHPQLHYYFFE